MDILNSGSGNLHEKKREALKQNLPPEQHNFFAPLNEMDPHQKETNPPKVLFQCRVYHIAGSEHSTEEMRDYQEIMNTIASGDATLVGENIYHSKDGDIRILLRWFETKTIAPAQDPGGGDNGGGKTSEVSEAKESSPSEHKRQRRKEKKAKKRDDDVKPPFPEPTVMM